MPLASSSLVRFGTACAVVIAFWVFGTGNARAGCGDHGYVVQRANGEVVVVTPSHPVCPCRGPQCKQSEPPRSPINQVKTQAPTEQAWSGEPFAPPIGPCGQPASPPSVGRTLAGHFSEILQPPRV